MSWGVMGRMMRKAGWVFPVFFGDCALGQQSPARFWCFPTPWGVLLLYTLGWEEQVLLSLGFSLPQPAIQQAKGFQPGEQQPPPLSSSLFSSSQLGMCWDPQGTPQTPHAQAGHHVHGSRE